MTGRDREPNRVLSERVSEVLFRDTCARILVMSSAYHRRGAVLVMAVEQVRPLESRVSNVISRNRCLCLRFWQILCTFSRLPPKGLKFPCTDFSRFEFSVHGIFACWWRSHVGQDGAVEVGVCLDTFREFGDITSHLLGFGWVVCENTHVGVATQVFTHP